MNKRIRGEDWKQLETLTQDMFEAMDTPTRNALAEAITPYREAGFNVSLYETHLKTCGYIPPLAGYDEGVENTRMMRGPRYES